MKKLFVILFMVFLSFCANAQTLKGGVYEEYIPNGFFGSWGVITKLQSTNSPNLFNYQSKDIWTLSGYNNILILDNFKTGATSKIEIKEKSIPDTLKFDRKIKKDKTIRREIVEFKLNGNKFSGTYKYIIEKYNEKNILLERNEAIYSAQGVKLPTNSFE